MIQDNVAQATILGDRCVVGHLAHLEGCTNRCQVPDRLWLHHHVASCHRRRTVTRAGAVVLRGIHLPPGAVAFGVSQELRCAVDITAAAPFTTSD